MSELGTPTSPSPWDRAQVQAEGQLLGTARRPLSWESLKGPRTFSASTDLPNWLQHAGAADFERAAGGCPWQRGLCGVGAWRGRGAQKGDREDLTPSQHLEERDRQTHGKMVREEQTSTSWKAG